MAVQKSLDVPFVIVTGTYNESITINNETISDIQMVVKNDKTTINYKSSVDTHKIYRFESLIKNTSNNEINAYFKMGLFCILLDPSEYDKMSKVVKNTKDTIDKSRNAQDNGSLETNDTNLGFQSVIVEDLNLIFGMFSLKLAISVVTKLSANGPKYFKEKQGSWCKWKDTKDNLIAIYFPKNNDNTVTSSTPTFNRFMSYFGKHWGVSIALKRREICTAIGLDMGWIGVIKAVIAGEFDGLKFGDIILPTFSSNAAKMWPFYTCTLMRTKPVKEWEAKEFDLCVFAVFSLINDIKNRAKNNQSDFFMNTMSAIRGCGIIPKMEIIYPLLNKCLSITNVSSSGAGLIDTRYAALIATLFNQPQNALTLREGESIVPSTNETEINKILFELSLSKNKRQAVRLTK